MGKNMKTGIVLIIVGIFTLPFIIGVVLLPLGIWIVVQVRSANEVLYSVSQYDLHLDIVNALQQEGYEVQVDNNKRKGQSYVRIEGVTYARIVYNGPPGAFTGIMSDMATNQGMMELLAEKFDYEYHVQGNVSDNYSEDLLAISNYNGLVHAVIEGGVISSGSCDDIYTEWLKIRKIVLSAMA